MNKRSLSTVITSLIMILLVLVAIGFVWIVVKNVISSGLEGISLESFSINLEIKNVNLGVNGINVTLKRGIGKGEVSKLKFIVSNDDTTEIIEKTTNIGELEQATFNINTTICMNKISVAPVIKLESGKEIIGEIKDTKNLDETNLVKNIPGLVSWWRFEGNANDEIGENDGTLMNGVNCNVQGKYGKACEFDAIDDYVNMGNDSSLHPSTFTLAAWIYHKGTIWNMIIGNEKTIGANTYSGFWLDIDENNRLYLLIGNCSGAGCLAPSYNPLNSTNSITLNNWTHVVATYDGYNMFLYINGIKDSNTANGAISYFNHSNNLSIGKGGEYIHFFNGTIDEVMIFNRALSADEIKEIRGCYFF